MRTSHSTILASLFFVAVSTLSGCVDDDVSVYVRGSIFPEFEGGTCSYDPDGAFVVRGTYDLLANDGNPYRMVLSLANQLRARGTGATSEPNAVHIETAEITLRNAAGEIISSADLDGSPNPFTIPVAGYADPSSGAGNIGLGFVPVAAIPHPYGQSLRDSGYSGETIVVSVKLYGETNGTIDIETGEWDWPVELCDGCLDACLPDGDDPDNACTTGSDFNSYFRPC